MNEHRKSPEEIEQEIQQTRRMIDGTIDALQAKLSPGQMLDRALGYAKSGGSDFAANLGRTVRDNPMPLLLTGVGLAWMITVSGNNGGGRSRAKRPAGQAGGTMPSESFHATNHPATQSAADDATDWDHLSDTVKQKTDAANDKAQSYGRAVGDGARAARDSAARTGQEFRDRAYDAGARFRDQAHEAREQASYYVDRARQKGDRAASATAAFIRENPLLIGAAGLALGAVVAAALPASRREDEWMGETSDRLKQDAKQAGQDRAEKAKSAAKDAARTAATEAKKETKGQEAGHQGDGSDPSSSSPSTGSGKSGRSAGSSEGSGFGSSGGGSSKTGSAGHTPPDQTDGSLSGQPPARGEDKGAQATPGHGMPTPPPRSSRVQTDSFERE